ncbi:MAG: hypothetical protein H6841_10715 [Planctomycetes bacterium]|nr:hypothetical protein [Planctomycetota bacterium]MCB9936288.1 hypothetical protein [Planctomycetota bacterium]
MRTLLLLALALACGFLQAALEPRDEALLQAWLNGEVKLPGALPVGYAHQFEVGDLQEAEVLDRGVYRTIRLHVVGKLEDRFVAEAHNGRGLVVAGLMDNNGVFSKAWAGRAGEKPVEVAFNEQPGQQALMHEALRMPWSDALYQLAASSFREGEKFKLGDAELTVQAPGYELSGVSYEVLLSHGEDAWFGPYWQWKAGERVLYKVKRREKLAKPEPLLEWSEVLKDAPKPAKAPEWKPPKDEWEITKREDGSLLVFSYDCRSTFSIDGSEPQPLNLPGPFVVPAGESLTVNVGDSPWEFEKHVLEQTARLPVSVASLSGSACCDSGLRALEGYTSLRSLTLFRRPSVKGLPAPPDELTADGAKAVARMGTLTELAILFMGQPRLTSEFWSALGDGKAIQTLYLKLPGLESLPDAIFGWKSLNTLHLWETGAGGIDSLVGLTELSLMDVTLSPLACGQVAALPKISKLALIRAGFPAGKLAQMQTLTELSIREKADEATWLIQSAGKLKALKRLELQVAGLVGEDLIPLRTGVVESLCVYGGLDRSDDVASLAKLKNVRELELTGVKGADVAALKALAAPGTLTKLTLTAPVLARSRKASEELAALAAFDCLQELHVREGGMAKAGPLGFAKFSKLKVLSLEKLSVETELLAELAACEKLEDLSFAGSLLPPDALETMKKLKTLKTLNLRGCLSIAPEDVAALKAALPDCAITR